MKAFAVALLSSLAPSLVSAYALVDENVAVDTRYPYKGPAVPVGSVRYHFPLGQAPFFYLPC